MDLELVSGERAGERRQADDLRQRDRLGDEQDPFGSGQNVLLAVSDLVVYGTRPQPSRKRWTVAGWVALATALSLQQGIAVYEDGRVGEAQAAFAEIARSRPTDADALSWLAAAELENTGDAAAAEQVLEQALRVRPDAWRAHMLLGVALAKRIGSASIFEKLSLAGRLKGEMEHAVELAPGSADARLALIHFYLRAPTIAGGGSKKARAQAAEIARIDPFEGAAALGLVEAYVGDDAAPSFRRAAELARTDKERARALSLLGKFRVAQKRPTESLPSFREAVAIRPRDPTLRADLGDGQLAAGDHQGAIASFRAASDLDPRLVAPWVGLGRALAQAGRRTEARAAYEEFLALAPRHERAADARDELQRLAAAEAKR
jgi:Flp pilus assembly protein TadD